MRYSSIKDTSENPLQVKGVPPAFMENVKEN